MRSDYLGSSTKCLENVTKAGAMVATVSLWLLMLLVAAAVTGRYLLNSPILAVDELSSYLVASLVFMGLAYTLVTDGHIRVTLLLSKLRM